MKRSDRNRAPLKDDTILKNFVAHHKLSFNRFGKKSGAYVETEIVCAVAQQNNIVICVAHCGIDRFQVFTPRGDFMDCSDENAVASPFFLWCTGGHYQAIVKVSDFEILASALESQPFKTSRLLEKNHFRFE